jgi:RNA recognition motif-containing protein
VKKVTKTLYVGNLPWSATKEDLAAFFAAQAQVKSSRIITDPANGRSRGFGFIEVEDEDVDRVIGEMNGKDMGGREIIVNEAKPRQANPVRM